jgi:alpha-tubulin suppressor-like RCC1 family protein
MPNPLKLMMATAGVSAGGKKLYTWGKGAQGQLGHGNTTDLSSPVQVGSLSDWSMVTTNSFYFTMAIKTNGSLWAIGGQSNYGQLGLGDGVTACSPTQVGSLTDWSTIAIGGRSTASIKTDGTLFTWGQAAGGQLGLGDTTIRSSPVQVGAQTDWASVSISVYSSGAIKTTGKLYTWGPNDSGQLGHGNTTSLSSPVQVGSLSDWSIVSASNHMMAIKTDGTLWGWGENGTGRIGDGTTTDRSSPVQIGSQTDWASIATSPYGSTIAIKTSGKMYSWGRGTGGVLGHGNTTNYSSPVQVGSLTNWGSRVSTSNNFSSAIKTDYTVWAWGVNSTGQLGQGNTTDTSSPVQVGSLTDWSTVSSGHRHIAGLIT